MMKKFWAISFLLGALPAWAVMELDLNYSWEHKSYGEDQASKAITQTYYASLAYYFLSSTALEINGSFDYKKTTNTLLDPINLNAAILYGSINRLKTYTYGVGLRQAFASPHAKIRPLIGFGWARQKQNDQNFYLMDLGGSTTEVAGLNYRHEQDVAYILSALRFALSSRCALKLSAVGTFKPFKWKEITRDIRYLGGLMIVF